MGVFFFSLGILDLKTLTGRKVSVCQRSKSWRKHVLMEFFAGTLLLWQQQTFNFEPDNTVGYIACSFLVGCPCNLSLTFHGSRPQILHVKQALQEKEGIQVDQIRCA